jgi:hypothetical protein
MCEFLEMVIASHPWEIVVFSEEGTTSRFVEYHDSDYKEIHGELWCDLFDTGESDVSGEIRRNGKVVLEMRKLGETCSWK